ncbi:MAG: tyrosine-type recombinase/integrase [Syntrophobacteraceae bacterium]|nr:tyrosine-type recombinase/integrase [Syntrophobacteraceae bacterium]
MSASLKPKTIVHYQSFAKAFIHYLNRDYPEVESPGELQRNPHILGWLQDLAARNPPLSNRTRLAALYTMRHLFRDLGDNGYPICEKLILRQDFPPRQKCLPIPVSPEVDNLMSQELHKTDDLLSNAILLIRATGMRVGECLGLKVDSLRNMGTNQWALHVPLGKLHNERLVPMDEEACRIFERILCLSQPARANSADSGSFLLLRPNGKPFYYSLMRKYLIKSSKRAQCPPVRLHQLRHTYATMMLRAGISLPALKEILGHKDLEMTMNYVQVSQTDLQREYHQARQKMARIHAVPGFAQPTIEDEGGIGGICGRLDTIKHQLEMYRRNANNESTNHKIQPLLRRIAKLRSTLATLQESKKGPD